MSAPASLQHRKLLRDNRSRSGRKAGFTLVELMVSISVLAILGGLVSQLMSSTSRLTSNSKQSSECDAEARYALSQISADLSYRVRRPDVDALVKKEDGNDEFFLFAETAGYAPKLSESGDENRFANRSTVSLIGYRVEKEANKNGLELFQLKRYARALPWTDRDEDKALPFVVLDSTGKPSAASTLAGTDGKGAGGSFEKAVTGDSGEKDYLQPIAQNVVRFEVSVVRKPDDKHPKAYLLNDEGVVTELSKNGFANIASIVFSIAVLDTQAAAKTKQQDIDSHKLDDTPTGDQLVFPVEKWNATFKDKAASMPRYLAAGIHFYERVVSLSDAF
jgi:prepilin-type N-terminal cleavage/methylation domain-containing protein